MENAKKKFTRKEIYSLKQCLRTHSPDDPLILLFQLTHALTEIEQVAKSSSSPDDGVSSLFRLYTIDQADILCVLNQNKDLVSFLESSAVRQMHQLISKTNKKKPPDALVLMIDARYLRVSESRDLFNHGRTIRTWVETIRNTSFQNIPIVLLVRNTEDLDGFEDWTQALDEQYLEDAFGFALPNEEIEAQSFISAALREMTAQLGKQQTKEKKIDSAKKRLILSLMALKQNLVYLTNGILQTQPDLTPPKFIGIYFMGMVDRSVPMIDETALDLLSDNALNESLPSEISIKTPLFVKDVCGDILSKVGSYTQPYQPESTHGLIYKTVSLSMILLIICACGLLFMSYLSHLDTLNHTKAGISMLQKNITTPQDTIPYFNALKNYMLDLEAEVNEWWLPWLGFSQEIDALNQMKYQYVVTFRKYLLKPLIDQYMVKVRTHMGQRSAVELSDQTFHHVTGQFMGTLVFYTDFLSQLFLSLEEKASFVYHPKGYHNGKAIFADPVSNERFNTFLRCYEQALLWANTRRDFRKDFYQFQSSIQEMVAFMPTLIEWVLPIVNDQLPGIQLTALWKKDFSEKVPHTEIPAAFTKQGYVFIQNIFDIIRKAHSHPAPFDERLHSFQQSFHEKYIQQWKTAAIQFSTIVDHLDGRDAWVDIMSHIADVRRNPFFQMIRLIVEHTQQFDDQKKKWPEWLAFSHALFEQTILEYSESIPLTKNTVPSDNESGKKSNETNSAFNEYLSALKEISTFPNTPERSYKMMETFFTNPGQFCPGDGPDTILCLSVFQLQSMWNKKNDQNAAFWDLYQGSVDFIQKFSLKEAACQLQQHWENQVLSTDVQSPGELAKHQKEGTQQFIQTVGQPFLEKITPTRYVPKRLAGLVIPFKESFFQYVAYHPGATQKLKDQYPVIIKATPSRTNANAEFQPQLTMIKMRCETNQQIIVIGHQPAQETFFWSESCGPVHIIFHLKDMKLTRTYPNPRAFPKFIGDVRYGSKRFQRSDFVLQNARLESMGIQYIELRLQLFGHEPLLSAQKTGFMAAPEQITACWERLKNVSEKSDKHDQSVPKNVPETTDEQKAVVYNQPKTNDQPLSQPVKQPVTQPEKLHNSEQSAIPPDQDAYILIIASFRKETNAVRKMHRLKQEGLNSSVYWLKDNNEKPWYIVVSGIFTDQNQATEQIHQIKEKYNISPFMKKMKKKIIDERQVKINF
ncbi:MAG: SPOR domain-containing protein [Candidatus Magnetomorum sp.]|nr:SPOR domain-containing protein [Candidatus Magnetomorum sp.]